MSGVGSLFCIPDIRSSKYSFCKVLNSDVTDLQSDLLSGGGLLRTSCPQITVF